MSRNLHAPNSPTVEEGEISSPMRNSSKPVTPHGLNSLSSAPSLMMGQHGSSGTFRSASLHSSNTNPIGIPRVSRCESEDREEGEIGFSPPSIPPGGFMAKRSSWGEGSSSSGGGGGGGSIMGSSAGNGNTSSILGGGNSGGGDVARGTYGSLAVSPPSSKGGPASFSSKVSVGTYASLCDTVENQHPGELHNVRKDTYLGVKHWEPPPSSSSSSMMSSSLPSRNRFNRREMTHPRINMPGKKYSKSSPTKLPWREGHREKESHVHRDISKPWGEKPRFEQPFSKWHSHGWKRYSSNSDGMMNSRNSTAGGVGGTSSALSGGMSAGGGNYYGPNPAMNGDDSCSSDNYASLAQPPSREHGSSTMKLSPGPRFEPPPGKDHEFSNMDKTLQKATVATATVAEEDGSAYAHAQLGKSPNKFRKDDKSVSATVSAAATTASSFVSTARTSFQRSILNQIHEVEEGQIYTDMDKRKDPSYDMNGKHSIRKNEMAASHTELPVSPKLSYNTSMKVDSTSMADVDQESIITAPKVTLTCSMLGDYDTVLKAKNAIKIMARVIDDDVYNDENLTSTDDCPLPAAESVTRAVQELQKKVKQGQQQLKLIKFKLKRSMSDDAQKRKEQEAKDLEVKSSLEDENMQAGISQDNVPENADKLDDNAEKRNNERTQVKKRLHDEMCETDESLSELEKKICDAIKAIDASNAIAAEKEVITKYDSIIGNAQKVSQEARAKVSSLSDAVASLASKLQLAENDMEQAPIRILEKSKSIPIETNQKVEQLPEKVNSRLQAILNETIDIADDMRDLVKNIMLENKATATRAQNESKSIVIPEVAQNLSISSSPPVLIPEIPTDNENAMMNFIVDWAKRAQSVTGPGDALYSEPSQAPFYEITNDKHEAMRMIVREHVRHNKRKLHHRWTELSQEYAIREQLYQKDSKRDSNGVHSVGLGSTFSICGQRRGGGSDDNSIFGPVDDVNNRSNNNPYRRPRRNAGLQVTGGDIVRSDYEQEQIIQQLTAQENMERRIRLGGSDIPRQVCSLEKEFHASYKDTMSSRRVDDMLQDQLTHDAINPWSDMEKCIFFDRFLQHPKDFRKISSFLKNKSTHDCIAFYYNSKQTVPYKAALKEHQLRKKKRGDTVSWEATIQAALSLGAKVTAGYDAEKPLLFHLPFSDLTYATQLIHPMKLKLFKSNLYETLNDESPKAMIRKRKSGITTTFTLEPSERKFLGGDSLSSGKRSSSSSDLDSLSSAKLTRPANECNVQDSNVVKEEKNDTSAKRGVSKWKKKEKLLFFESLEKYGKNWQAISDVIETKTATQARNFYYDNKRQNAKNKGMGKAKVNAKVIDAGSSLQSLGSQEVHPLIEKPSSNSSMIKNDPQTYSVEPGSEVCDVFSESLASTGSAATDWIHIRPPAWHGSNQQQQYALALEQHRLQQHHLSEQQRILEQQYAHQHLMEQQRHLQHQQHFLGLINSQQNDMVGNVPPWLTTRVLQQHIEPSVNSIRGFVDGSAQMNLAFAMRQLTHPQQSNPSSVRPSDGDLGTFPAISENTDGPNRQNKNA